MRKLTNLRTIFLLSLSSLWQYEPLLHVVLHITTDSRVLIGHYRKSTCPVQNEADEFSGTSFECEPSQV